MAFECGTVQITGTGDKEVNLSGAFQPNLLIVTCSSRTSAGTSNKDTISWGATDGTNTVALATVSEDDVPDMDTARRHDTTKLIYLFEADHTLELAGTLKQFDADGFTLNISTHSGSNKVLTYYAFKVTSATVLTDETFPASTGTQAFTGAASQPDGLIIAGVRASATNTTEDGNFFFVGFASGTGSTEECCSATSDEDNVTDSNTKRHFSTDSVYAALDTAGLAEEANLDSLDSGGFTLNVTNAGSSEKFVAVCITGDVKVKNSESLNSSTGSQSFTGAGFTPEGICTISSGAVTADTVTDGALMSMGAASGSSNDNNTGYISTDNSKSAAVECWWQTNIYANYGSGGGSPVYALSFTSLDSDGWTGNVDTAASGHLLGWLAVAEGSGGGGSTAWRGGLPLLGVG